MATAPERRRFRGRKEGSFGALFESTPLHSTIPDARDAAYALMAADAIQSQTHVLERGRFEVLAPVQRRAWVMTTDSRRTPPKTAAPISPLPERNASRHRAPNIDAGRCDRRVRRGFCMCWVVELFTER